MSLNKNLLSAAILSLASLPQSLIDAARERALTGRASFSGHHRRSDKVGGPRRAVPYAQLAPKVDGVRMRWEHGRLVPRTQQSALPFGQRKMDRLAAKRAKLKAANPPPKRIRKGGWERGDLKGIMRAARRAGIISPRQQRKYHKAKRREAREQAS